ncbi:MAG: bifunctional protein-serine/threonine kinase/phosphatase [Halioglobus sp.]|nr:bifunctional protein-serine/threonine kinase/phosphatase [Halioglobus sp.]
MSAAQPLTKSPPVLSEGLQLSVGQHSAAGRKGDNEDAIGIRVPSDNLLATKGAVAVIADGVSAAEAGREASHTSVMNFLSDYFATPESWSVKQSAQQVLTALNRWLYGRGRSYLDASKGFVTTFSAVVFKSQTAHIFHVGDSRVYRLRDGLLEQLTQDHTTRVSAEQTYLARAMGLDVRLDVDYSTHELAVGDVYLLSTDGVHDVLPNRDIRGLLTGAPAELEAQCEQLVNAGLAAGSKDNLSCQLLRVEALPDAGIDEVITRLTALRFPAFLEPGMLIDGYRVLRELHASNRSQVYQVEDEASGEHFCMKTPSVNFEDDAAYIERFVMEAWTGSRINSPYVVKVRESARPRSCLYYLTDYVRGMTLTQWMRENPKPAVEEAVYLIEQIGKGVRAMHRRETLHQDIKPDNILVDHNGQVKIVDFGSCHVAGLAEISTPIARDVPLGTATYSAPEYTLGIAPDYRADLFSLAVVSYEMLTGELPFGGKLENCRTQRDYLATRYTASHRLNPLVPHWIDGALKKGLRLQPERRHADIAEFVYELQNPNPKYLEYRDQPLLERDPLTAWKVIAGVLALTQVVTLALWLS